MARTIKAVLFDVGGVLHLPDHETMRTFLGDLADGLPGPVIDRAHYLAVALAERWVDGPQRADFAEYLRRYLFALGVPRHDLESAADRYVSELGAGKAWRAPVSGAAETLRELAKSGRKLGIVSNTMAGGVADRLRETRMCQVGEGRGTPVEVVVDSHELGVRKPDPAIFQAALEALALEAAEVAFVGDALDADVAGATAVGITPVHFDPLSMCLRGDHHHVQSLQEVPSLVRSARRAAPIHAPSDVPRLDSIEVVLDDAAAWAVGREDVRGLCVVGSYARGTFGQGSDLDLVLLSARPLDYIRSDQWVRAFDGFSLAMTRQWGTVMERRLRRADGLELDVAIAEPGWAATAPLDTGTGSVVKGGFRILHDPDRSLARLRTAVAPG